MVNLTDGRDRVPLAAQTAPRILASNTKLFTTAAALARFGTEGTLGTEVLGAGALDEDGRLARHLYLRGGGRPHLRHRELRGAAATAAGPPWSGWPRCSRTQGSSA